MNNEDMRKKFRHAINDLTEYWFCKGMSRTEIMGELELHKVVLAKGELEPDEPNAEDPMFIIRLTDYEGGVFFAADDTNTTDDIKKAEHYDDSRAEEICRDLSAVGCWHSVEAVPVYTCRT